MRGDFLFVFPPVRRKLQAAVVAPLEEINHLSSFTGLDEQGFRKPNFLGMSSNDVVKAEEGAVVPLLTICGSADNQSDTPDAPRRSAENPKTTPNGPRRSAENPKKTPDGQEKQEIETYRNLALASIICGCSCIGYKALRHSFEAEYQEKEDEAAQARKYSIISIVTFFGILISIPLLICLVSYLLTLID